MKGIHRKLYTPCILRENVCAARYSLPQTSSSCTGANHSSGSNDLTIPPSASHQKPLTVPKPKPCIKQMLRTEIPRQAKAVLKCLHVANLLQHKSKVRWNPLIVLGALIQAEACCTYQQNSIFLREQYQTIANLTGVY